MFLAYNNSINMTNISKNIKQRGITPIVTVIILIVISTILVLMILSFGREHTNKSLERTNDIDKFTVSDAESFIYPKEMQNGVLLFNYNPPADIEDKEITITGYKIANVSGMEPIQLETPFTFSANSQNVLVLDCLYEHSVKDKVDLKLITADYKYIDISVRDPDMVCSSGGTGTEEDPIVICNADDLNAVRLNLDANYVLGKDIDLKCYSRREEEGWEPIGTDSSPFSGSFDGQNHIISNMYINRPTTSYVGLFGYIDFSIIKNLTIIDFNITGYEYVGGLTGYSADNNISNISSQGTTNAKQAVGGLIGYSTFDYISNCNSKGSVIVNNISVVGFAGGLIGIFSEDQGDILEDSFSSATVGALNPARSYMGGLIGYSSSERISGCYATGKVYGSGYVGGLIGYSSYTNTIENCFATGEIIFNQVEGKTGGLIGYSEGGDIKKSYAICSILGDDQEYIGGLIGQLASGSVSDCYSIGEISGYNFVGGLIGSNEGTDIITSSYAAVEVSGNSSVGGLLGYNENGAFTGSYWDTNISETLLSDGGEGKTTEEMKQQQTYVGWDFTNVWAIDPNKNNGYPYLIFNTGD